MQKQTWADYVATTSNGDQKNVIAGKVGVDPATVGRWMRGTTTPQPLQVIAFARAYGLSPIPGLIAVGYLTPEDVSDNVVIQSSPTLDSIATHTLIDELERRLEVMSDYAGWVRAIANGSGSPARLGVDALRYLDPSVPPANVRGDDFVTALAPHVTQISTIGDQDFYGLADDLTRARNARDVGAPSQDEEAAAETDIPHEEDTDDYTP